MTAGLVRRGPVGLVALEISKRAIENTLPSLTVPYAKVSYDHCGIVAAATILSGRWMLDQLFLTRASIELARAGPRFRGTFFGAKTHFSTPVYKGVGDEVM
jgi:hypothetical protein